MMPIKLKPETIGKILDLWITKHSVNEPDFRYCPHCGAKMDGDKHDTEE